jgi:hypothetical protein
MSRISVSLADRLNIPPKSIYCIRIPKNRFTLEEANLWIIAHGYDISLERKRSRLAYTYVQNQKVMPAEQTVETLDNGIKIYYQTYQPLGKYAGLI